MKNKEWVDNLTCFDGNCIVYPFFILHSSLINLT